MNFEAFIEFIEMGGQVMIRAMAKNYKNIAAVADTPRQKGD